MDLDHILYVEVDSRGHWAQYLPMEAGDERVYLKSITISKYGIGLPSYVDVPSELQQGWTQLYIQDHI